MGRFRRALTSPLDAERRAMLPIQILTRWLLVATTLVLVNFRPRAETALDQLELNLFIASVAAFNLYLHARHHRGQAIPTALPVVSGLLDLAAITASLRIIEGFDNVNFVIYYPELLAFVLLFPGVSSLLVLAGTCGAYVAFVALDAGFDAGAVQDWKDLFTRFATLAVMVAVANLGVSIERRRRVNAVNEAVAAHIERERVAREIHDGVAQGVYMLAVNLEANARTLQEDASQQDLRQRLEVLTDIAKHTLLDTRGLLHNLQPVMAGAQPLDSLLTDLGREFTAVTGLPVTVDARKLEGRALDLEPAAIGEIYRVVQEALANVYKHAQAHGVTLRLTTDGDAVQLEVIDDGRGFEPSSARVGHGLLNQRERARAVGGTLEVDTAPGEGTRVRLRVPRATERAHA